MATPRAKTVPDVNALAAKARAELQREQALRLTAVAPPSARGEVMAVLKAEGYEVTATTVRVPIEAQLEGALGDGSFLSVKSLAGRLRGATAAEAKLAVGRLVDAGRARRVMRTTEETIVPVSANVLSASELVDAAKRLLALAKLVQTVARKKATTTLLRDDVAQALDRVLGATGVPSVTSKDLGPEIARVLQAIDEAREADADLTFVPKVVDLLSSKLDVAAVRAALLVAASRGLVELRPEGGIGRLSPAELAACPEGPHGTRLSWARRIEVSS
jgi:hypothetical protein